MEAISFARGVPAPELIPVRELAECARAAVERDGAALSYGSAAGYPPLRAWVAERHGVEPDRVVLTNGSLQAFVLLAQHLLDERGRRVVVEAPTYDRPLKILASLGADVVAIPGDDEALDVDAAAAVIAGRPRPAFLYTIPTFQNPSGRTLTPDRRRRLVELAREHDVLVVEDDPYGLLRFEGDPVPTLFELAGGDGIVHSSSFSKTVAPGLRVGYLVAPPHVAAAVEALAASTYIAPALLGQATVFEFLRRRLLDENLRRVRELLRLRRDAMLTALEREFPAGARWSRPQGGYFVWLELPEPLDAGALLADALEAGVTFVKGTDFFPPRLGGTSSARLAYSLATPAEIDEGIVRLARLLPALAAA